MAWLVGDGFDFYSSAADLNANTSIWKSQTQCVLNTGGRFGGTGRYIQLGNNSVTAGNLFTVQFTNSQTLFVNANIISASNAHVNGGTTQCMGFTLRDTTANIQCGVWLRNGGDFVLTSGGIGSAVLATSPVLMPLASTWAHIQVKIFVHNTTGSIELRLNGNTSADWTATGLNTRNGTANNFANVVHWNSNSAGNEGVDDFYVFNDQGAQPNNFQGAVLAVRQFPNSDNAVTWTRSGGANNCLAVDDPQQDGDSTYVATGVVNNVDTYGMTSVSPTPASIIAVCPRYLARMEEAGPHTVTASLTSGATTVNFPNFILTNAYGYQAVAYAQDPNTSAAWTAVAVNALLLSIKDVL